MAQKFVGGVLVEVPETVTDKEAAEITREIQQKQAESNKPQMSDEEIKKLLLVPGGGQTIPVPSEPVKTAQPSPMPPSEIIRQEQAAYKEQQRQETLRQISEQPTTSGKMTSTIPFDRRSYEAIDFGNNAGRTIWRALTPWSEERGETNLTYIKDIPRRMMEGDTQIELKETYEAEQDNPLWVRLLFGGDTVIKDPKTGEFIEIVAGEAPLITPAGRGASLVKTIPVNYEKILDAARKSRLANAWEKTLSYIKAGERIQRIEKLEKNAQRASKNVSKAAERASKYKRQVDIRNLINEQLKAHKAYEAAKLAKLEAIRKAQRAPAILSIPGFYIDPKVFNKEVETTLSKLSPTKALNELNKTGLTPVFLLSHPGTMTKLINQVDAKTQAKTIEQVETAIQEGTENKTITKTQEKQATELVNEIKEQTQTQTETETQSKEETETKTQTQTETKTKTETPITTKQRTPKPPQQKGKDKSSGGGDAGTGSGNWRLPRTSFENKTARKIIKNSGGAIAWRQGRLNKKDVWYVVVHPYSSNENLIRLLGKRPEGTTILQRGKGSAYGTTQVVRGKAPKRDVKVDSGIVDITIRSVGKRSVRMKVTPDPKQETTGDITIGRRKNLRITPRIPKLR